jgi:hypothetical protein
VVFLNTFSHILTLPTGINNSYSSSLIKGERLWCFIENGFDEIAYFGKNLENVSSRLKATKYIIMAKITLFLDMVIARIGNTTLFNNQGCGSALI